MRIREARERAGKTQQWVAARVGVSSRTFGNWERGESVPRNRLARLEQVLGVKLRDRGDQEPGEAGTVTPAPQDPEPSADLPVGAGVDPVDISHLSPEDQEYVRGLVKRLERQRGDDRGGEQV
ncbi:helix-turn-helix transcriptional regulator [Blastococcus sp. SYSU D00813]